MGRRNSRGRAHSAGAKLRHKVIPIAGEAGRFQVESASEPGEFYVVDVDEEELTNAGVIHGTCPCKGWMVRKTCSHLTDARAYQEYLEVAAFIP